MNSKKKIRFAQLSLWFTHAYGICNAAKMNPLSELVRVWDEDGERGKQAARRFDSVYDGRDCMIVLEAAERFAHERRES